MRRHALTVALLGPLSAHGPAQDAPRILDATMHHLGDTRVETWPGVAAEPEGPRWQLVFQGRTNAGEQTLSVRHRDVDELWRISLNGTVLARLEQTKATVVRYFALPPGALRDGDNTVVVEGDKPQDDIAVGDLRLDPRPLRESLALQIVRIRVHDPKDAPLPARVTVTDPRGELVDLYYADRLHTAVRKGIAYTADGAAQIELPPGDYAVTATRGAEWGLARRGLHVPSAASGTAAIAPLDLPLAREVDTTGFVAVDSHVHTLTFSGHGDATVEERMVTLAGEGVEVAIATDHNHNTDYRPTQAAMGLQHEFVSVTGNEVTTEVGHMNAFPLDPHDAPPDHTLKDWVRLMSEIRGKGAKVVVLNHPRWPQIPTGPFGVYHLDRMTGALHGQQMPFDAMELANAGALQPDPLYLFVDWFALLNHGERVTAVGTSDSHTVGEPVGQGRTYVRSATDKPADVDLDAVYAAFRAGDTSISLGLFCDLVVDGRYHMGDLVPAPARSPALVMRVEAPSWIQPRRALVFVDGVQVAEQSIASAAGKPTDVRLSFAPQLPGHDAWLVCVALGDGVEGAHWRTDKPYTLAASNPVYFDVDGDDQYSAPLTLARALLAKTGVAAAPLRAALRSVDDAVAVEALALVRTQLEGDGTDATAVAAARARLREITGDPPSRPAFARYLASLP